MRRKRQYALQLMRHGNDRKGPKTISDHGKDAKARIKEANRWMNPLGPKRKGALKAK